MASNLERISRAYAAWTDTKGGNIAEWGELMADNIHFGTIAPRQGLEFAGAFKSRAEALNSRSAVMRASPPRASFEATSPPASKAVLAQFSQFGQYPLMKTIAATDAKNRFGELIDMAQSEPVRVQRQGRDAAVVLSPDEFRRLSETASGKVGPAVQKLHATSARRWSKVYEALAK